MKIDAFPHYIFWSYNKTADLPEDLVTEQVLLYGDLDDLFRLSDLVSPEVIAAANDKISAKGHWLKRVNFVNKVILGK
ncbi:MAG: hypothetical protein NTU44_05950 [Bacteroidetes bacterium]|nr:hypothetical protein [Bacteroidota bacterium]